MDVQAAAGGVELSVVMPLRERYAVGDVFRDCPVEEEHVLKNHRHIRSQARQGGSLYVLTINEHFSGYGIVETLEERDDCGLSDTGRSDERYHLTGLRLERDIIEKRLFSL